MTRLSIGNIDKSKEKRGRGRVPTGAVPILVRVYPGTLDRVDAWIAAQREPGLTRPEAIRRLTDQALLLGRPIKERGVAD